MALSEAELALIVTGKDQGASKVLDDVDKKTSGLGDTMGKVGAIAGGFLAANVIQGGVQKLTGFVGDSVSAIKESIQVNTQLDAVLKSTGGTVGLTATQIKDYAASLEKKTLFEDEAIISGQNLLLTFTNIKSDASTDNEIFQQTTDIMLDMAQALGTDASGSAIQLGKALNDPVQGISALSRVGVSFTDQQKEQIKTMQESGDMTGAQVVILDELRKEFGGSAKAASDAAGAQERYKDKMNDLQETIGAKVLPIQQKWMEVQIIALDFITSKVIPILESLYTKYYPGISDAITKIVGVVQQYWPQISAVIEFGANFVIAKIQGLIQMFQGFWETVSGIVNLFDDLFHGRWSQLWGDLEQIARGIVDSLVGYLRFQFGNIPEILFGLVNRAWDAGTALGKALANGMIRAVNGLLNSLSGRVLIPGISAPLIGQVTPEVRIPGLGSISELASGLDYVPYDNFPALLHRGERVMTAAENAGGGGILINLNFYGPVGVPELDAHITDVIKQASRRNEFRGYSFGG